VEEQRQDRLVQFAAKNRVKLRVIGIVILALAATLVAAIVLPSTTGPTICTRTDAARGDIASLGRMLEEFMVDNARYASTLKELFEGENKYFEASSVPLDPWGKAYVYRCPGVHDTETYDLISCGPDGLAGTEDDVTSWNTDNR
jgi:general secretion pathway protein G